MFRTSSSLYPFGYLGRITLPSFLRALFLSTFALVVILLVIKSKEIAKVGVLGISITGLLQLTFSQISYVLPFLLPITAALSGWAAADQLSSTHQFLALRFSGYSLRSIIRPLLSFSLLLSAFNFVLISEVSTLSHRVLDAVEKGELNRSPFLPLQHRGYLQYNNLYLRTLTPPTAHKIDGIQGFYYFPSLQRISFFQLNQLLYRQDWNPHLLEGFGLSIIGTHLSSPEEVSTDQASLNKAPSSSLYIERAQRITTSPQQLFQIFNTTPSKHHDNYLTWKELASRKALLVEQIDSYLKSEAKILMNTQTTASSDIALQNVDSLSPEILVSAKSQLRSVSNEALKRFYISLAPTTLFLLGYLSSLYYRHRTTTLLRILLLAFCLLGFIILVFWSKALSLSPELTFMVYAGFHLLTVIISFTYWLRLEKGVK
jgi:lipopolysaccharide export LptBFGC system permease protein LptF